MAAETEYSRFRAGKDLEMQRLELQAKSFESSLPKQFSLLNIKKGMAVLDAGCGTGSFARSVAKLVPPGSVLGLDVDATFIQEAQRLSEKSGLSNVDFKIGDVYNLEFADQTFDLTYCRFVLVHLSNPAKAVSEMIRVTKKDGCVASMDEGGLYVYPSGSLDKFFSLFGKLAQWRNANQGTNTVEKTEAASLLASAGLTEISVFPMPTYASSEEHSDELRNLATVPRQMIDLYKDEIIKDGFMKDKEYIDGMTELDEWLDGPNSFWMVLTILTLGKISSK
jgi:ubiquinone/menaquinone biosynthesis C-methylase UbiE